MGKGFVGGVGRLAVGQEGGEQNEDGARAISLWRDSGRERRNFAGMFGGRTMAADEHGPRQDRNEERVAAGADGGLVKGAGLAPAILLPAFWMLDQVRTFEGVIPAPGEDEFWMG